jgi:hypothetical protein
MKWAGLAAAAVIVFAAGSASAAQFLVDVTGSYSVSPGLVDSGQPGRFDYSFIADTGLVMAGADETFYFGAFTFATLTLSNPLIVPGQSNYISTIILPTSIQSYLDIGKDAPAAPVQFNKGAFEVDTDGNGAFGSLTERMNTILSFQPPPGVLPPGLASVTYQIQPGDGARGALQVGGAASGPQQNIELELLFTPTTLTISAIPEPATWLMMMAGFAGLGAGLRARRRLAVS